MIEKLLNKLTERLLRRRVDKDAAWKFLIFAEKVYLLANGWEEVGHDTWDSPFGYPKDHVGIRQGHAINSMKKWGHSWPQRKRA
jgi:hypothetical protein